MARIRCFSWFCLTLQIVVACPLAGYAAGKDARAKSATRQLDLEALRKDLASGDSARILSALEVIKQAGPSAKAAAPAVADVLARGASIEVALAAFEACRVLALPTLSAPIAIYLRHRAPQVRQMALGSLLSTGGPDAVRALRQALRASNAALRDLAAAGLGKLNAREATADLLTALDHKVWPAATSLGQLCSANECENFMTRLGKLPFDVMALGIEALLLRSAQDAPDAVKLRVIGRVRDLSTPAARDLLKKILGQWPANGSAAVRAALQEALGNEANP